MTTAEARRRRGIEQKWLTRVTLVLLVIVALTQLKKNDELSTVSNQNRATLCGLSRLIIASPNVYVPEFETKEQFHQITRARADVLALVRDINCSVVLAAALPQSRGGGDQSPSTGGQLPGDLRVPRPSRNRISP